LGEAIYLSILEQNSRISCLAGSGDDGVGGKRRPDIGQGRFGMIDMQLAAVVASPIPIKVGEEPPAPVPLEKHAVDRIDVGENGLVVFPLQRPGRAAL
jgi:hypothetical protein